MQQFEQARSLFYMVCLALGLTQLAYSQGYGPLEATKQMTVADGLAVELVASEPLVRQPVCIEFDDRGRLWVVQYLQYPNPEGLKRKQVDRYSRTEYDRVPPPPPQGPAGADRITILSDTDGDGRMDSGQDFVSGLNLTSGIAFGHGGVFVLNVPYLLFYPDRDRDDVPDSNPEVLLNGFGMQDAHSVANSLTWGPDGWLYGCQGSTVTANIRGIEFQQGVWRYHPRTKAFELFCEGGGNSWGLDFDADGHLLYSTNYGGYVLLHGVQGGNYVKSFAKHGELHNPYSYGYFEHAPHENFRGGHVTVGGIVYQADALPPEYRGRYIAGDLLGHAAYTHALESLGSTFRTRTVNQLLDSHDTWFAPTDVTTGPDGCIYISDWHDARTAHPDPDAEWDRSNGRIYAITPIAGRLASTSPDLTELSVDQLLALHSDRNQWIVRRARQELVRRNSRELGPRLLQAALQSTDGNAAVQSLWTWLSMHDPVFESNTQFFQVADQLLSSPHAAVRAWTIRWLGDIGRVPDELAHRLDSLAETEPDVHVRSQLASTAARLPAAQALPIINANINRDIDFEDPFLPLQWWWAVEKHSVSGRDEVMRRFVRKTLWESRLGSQFLMPRLIRRFAAEGTDEAFIALRKLLYSAPSDRLPELWPPLLAGWQEVPADQREQRDQLAKNHMLSPFIVWHWMSREYNPSLASLAVFMGNALPRLRAAKIVSEPGSKPDEVLGALSLLASHPHPSSLEPVQQLLATSPPEPLMLAGLNVLARFDQTEVTTALIKLLSPAPSNKVSQRIHEILFSRSASALAWLQQVDAGQIKPDSVSIEQVRTLTLLSDPEIDKLVLKHWGKLNGASAEERLAEVRRLNNDLRAAEGSAEAGKQLFARHCANCHKLHGQGGAVGPDLTSANRQDRDFLLISLVDPSAVVRKEYMSSIVRTQDDRVLTGLISREPDGSLKLTNAKAETQTIQADEIAEVRPAPSSLMPEDIYKQLTPQELRDLFAYLRS